MFFSPGSEYFLKAFSLRNLKFGSFHLYLLSSMDDILISFTVFNAEFARNKACDWEEACMSVVLSEILGSTGIPFKTW